MTQTIAREKIDPARLKAIVVGSLGNLVEYYDFYVYAAFSLYFAPSFFPGTDKVAQMLASAGIFALGFFMRPIGGWLFGYIGDHYGRRRSLMLSVLMMCAGSLAIAVTPGYAADRRLGADSSDARAPGPGPQSRRRIRRQRHLCRGNGRFRPARLLFQLSLCDADRRPARRARPCC